MSLKIALARAEYRYLCNLSDIVVGHYHRSGRVDYLNYLDRLFMRRSDVRRRCAF